MLSRLPRGSARRLAAGAALGSLASRPAASRLSAAARLPCLQRLSAVAPSTPYPTILRWRLYSSQPGKKKEEDQSKHHARPGGGQVGKDSGDAHSNQEPVPPAQLPKLPDGWVWLSVEQTNAARPILLQSVGATMRKGSAKIRTLEYFWENATQIMVPTEVGNAVASLLVADTNIGELTRVMFSTIFRAPAILVKMSDWPGLIERHGWAVLKSGESPNPNTTPQGKQDDQHQGAAQKEQQSPRRDEGKETAGQKQGKQETGSDEKSADGQSSGRQGWGGKSSGGKDGESPGGTPKFPRTTWTDALVATVGTLAVLPFLGKSGGSGDITWQELRRNFLDKGLVERLEVHGNVVKVFLNREAVMAMYPDSPAAKSPYFTYSFNIGSVEAFERRLEDAQTELGIPPSDRIPVRYLSQDRSILLSLFFAFGPTLMMVGLIAWGLRNVSSSAGGRNNPFSFGKSQAKRFNHETAVKVKFEDVAGMDEAKLEIQEFVSFLKTPDRFQRLGAKIPRGAILSGPPGTGKTLLAKATAGESQVPFFSVSGSEFVEMFVGVGASRVRDLFSSARKNAPCIIFIDEIDAIGRSRESSMRGGGNDEREATLNQILTEMDGFNTSEQVVVLAGTNRPDVLDAALTRPGRFDRRIHIDRPTMKGRQAIFKVHLRKIVHNEDLDQLVGRLAVLTPGFAGADIANACNEAALVAARANAESVTIQHFEQAIERVIAGLERKSLVLSDEEKKTVAYHEAGHAVCGWFFRWADPLLKVSIIPRGSGALGYAQYVPGDAYLMTTSQLMDRMAMTLGGRVSEEMHFDTVTTGASDDFRKVTTMATTMVTQWGMSKKIGPLHYQNDQNQLQKPFAEATAQVIDAEVRSLIDQAYQQCKELLEKKRKEIGIVAEELLRKEVLTREDMVRLLGRREWADKEDFSKFFGDVAGSNKEAGGNYPPPVAGPEAQTAPPP